MHVLQISADRSKRGILVPGTSAFNRQKAYADRFGTIDIIGFSLKSDGFKEMKSGALHTYPTNAPVKVLYGWYARLIARRLRVPDIIISQDPHDTGLLALYLARMRGVPFYSHVHTDIFASQYRKRSTPNFIRSLIARFVLKRADGIRVVSERIKRSIDASLRTRGRISVLPIFVDTRHFQEAQADPALQAKFAGYKTKLLFVGRLEAEKNPRLALRSFAQSAPSDSCLIFVGSGREAQPLANIAQVLGVSGRVFFEGDQDPASYYKLADLVLVTSLYEGYGMVTIEALAAGTPVLSTDVGIAREAGARVAESGEFPQALASWIENGERTGELRYQPYADFSAYVQALCADIRACRKAN